MFSRSLFRILKFVLLLSFNIFNLRFFICSTFMLDIPSKYFKFDSKELFKNLFTLLNLILSALILRKKFLKLL